MAIDWPDADELVQVLDISNPDDWSVTIDSTLASAIAIVKSNVGDWDEATDEPTENMARAALRMAVLISQQPAGVTNESLVRDPTYQMLLTGQRRKWGMA